MAVEEEVTMVGGGGAESVGRGEGYTGVGRGGQSCHACQPLRPARGIFSASSLYSVLQTACLALRLHSDWAAARLGMTPWRHARDALTSDVCVAGEACPTTVVDRIKKSRQHIHVAPESVVTDRARILKRLQICCMSMDVPESP